MKVPFSYLSRQFAEVDAYLEDVRAHVLTGDFTLGKPLKEFEESASPNAPKCPTPSASAPAPTPSSCP